MTLFRVRDETLDTSIGESLQNLEQSNTYMYICIDISETILLNCDQLICRNWFIFSVVTYIWISRKLYGCCMVHVQVACCVKVSRQPLSTPRPIQGTRFDPAFMYLLFFFFSIWETPGSVCKILLTSQLTILFLMMRTNHDHHLPPYMYNTSISLPEKLAWITTSKFILDTAIQFKLVWHATEWIADQFKISMATELVWISVSDSLGGTVPKLELDGCIQY
jgi:hypothetical protein